MQKTIMKTFSRRLRGRRKQLGLTLAQVSEETGYSTSSLSTWEKGQREPRLDALFWLAKTLDVSTDWLLGLSDE